MKREKIKELALANGFKLKTQPDGTEDLNPYVYDFSAALLESLRTVNEIAISDLHSCKLALGKALQEQEQLKAQVNGLKQALDDLVRNSEGVAGLHLNGDVAPWDELLTGGRFEEWLAVFDETPEQSLAVNDAEAIRAAITKTRTALHRGGQAWLCRVDDLEAYADRLLKQAKEVQS